MSESCVAVVTGSNKGIGLAIVRALCKQFKGDVYLTSRNPERGTEAVKKLEAEGLKPKFHQLDVTEQKSIETIRDYMVKTYGGIDVFVHNAGMAFKNADPTPFSQQATVTVGTNFTSTVNVCNTILPVMKTNGRFVNVSSMASIMTLEKCSQEQQQFFKSPDLTEEKLVERINEFVEAAQTGEHQTKGFANWSYGMSKLGMTALTRILGKRAATVCKPNVLINCCCPGWVHTDMGGDKASLTPDQGAETPVFLALLPKGSTEPNGEFFKDKKVRKW